MCRTNAGASGACLRNTHCTPYGVAPSAFPIFRPWATSSGVGTSGAHVRIVQRETRPSGPVTRPTPSAAAIRDRTSASPLGSAAKTIRSETRAPSAVASVRCGARRHGGACSQEPQSATVTAPPGAAVSAPSSRSSTAVCTKASRTYRAYFSCDGAVWLIGEDHWDEMTTEEKKSGYFALALLSQLRHPAAGQEHDSVLWRDRVLGGGG
jgi:hypothetical protein